MAIRVKANVASESGSRVYEGMPIEASVRSFRDETVPTGVYYRDNAIIIDICKGGAGHSQNANMHYALVKITYKGLEVIFDEVVGRLRGNPTEIKRLANLLLKIRDNCIRKL